MLYQIWWLWPPPPSWSELDAPPSFPTPCAFSTMALIQSILICLFVRTPLGPELVKEGVEVLLILNLSSLSVG